MVTRMHQLELVTNNLANIDTKGFKRDQLFVDELDRRQKEIEYSKFESATHFPHAGSIVDLEQGSLAPTGQTLDVAISGEGFFTVETPAGEALTRDGRFGLNTDGVLVNLDGYPVLGDGGPIEIDLQQSTPSQIVINDQGEILVDGQVVSTLQIVTTDRPQDLVKIGANLMRLAPGPGTINPAENVSVRQSFLEDSNVEPVEELVTMMEIFHFYQAGEKMLQEQDRLLGRAVNDIAKQN